LKQGRAVYEPNPAKAADKMKMIRGATGPTLYSWLMSKYDAIGEATTRGEWVDGRPDELVCAFMCMCLYIFIYPCLYI
jgi:hypothetical protein